MRADLIGAHDAYLHGLDTCMAIDGFEGGTKGQDECKEGRLAPQDYRHSLTLARARRGDERPPPEDEERREGTMVRLTSPLCTLAALLALCSVNAAAKTVGGGIRGVRALVRFCVSLPL